MQPQSVPSGAPSVAFPFTERHVQHVLPHTHLSSGFSTKQDQRLQAKALKLSSVGYKIQLNGQRAAAPYVQHVVSVPLGASYNIL